MYVLYDTFNNCVISRHRMIETAARAANSHTRSIKQRYGDSSYIPTDLYVEQPDRNGYSQEPVMAPDEDREFFDHRRANFK